MAGERVQIETAEEASLAVIHMDMTRIVIADEPLDDIAASSDSAHEL